MHAIAHGAPADTTRESAPKVDSGKKIPCRTGESNLPQRRAGPKLYQLSFIPTQSFEGTSARLPERVRRSFLELRLFLRGVQGGQVSPSRLRSCWWSDNQKMHANPAELNAFLDFVLYRDE